MDKGLRFNEGKTRYDLVPAFAQEQYAKVLTKGSEKYAERNWERGMEWSKVLASLKRHIAVFEKGEDYDKETGLLHTAHMMCNAAFLTEYYKIYPQGDNRPHQYLSMPKIGLDIDEVICDWVNPWREHWEIKDVATSWFFDREIMDRFKAMEADGSLDEFYLNLPKKISSEDLPFEPHCYITSRPVEKGVTEAWLDKHNFPTKPVYCVGSGQSKVEIAKESGIDIFVDDCFSNFEALNNAGICCYLFDAPHNQRYNVGHKRIKSLSELAHLGNPPEEPKLLKVEYKSNMNLPVTRRQQSEYDGVKIKHWVEDEASNISAELKHHLSKFPMTLQDALIGSNEVYTDLENQSQQEKDDNISVV